MISRAESRLEWNRRCCARLSAHASGTRRKGSAVHKPGDVEGTFDTAVTVKHGAFMHRIWAGVLSSAMGRSAQQSCGAWPLGCRKTDNSST